MKAVATRGVSIALACRTFQVRECCYRYERMLSDENSEIAEWLVRLTTNRRTWGFGLCFLYSLMSKDWLEPQAGLRIYANGAELVDQASKALKRDKPDALAVTRYSQS